MNMAEFAPLPETNSDQIKYTNF
ncbi:hypothetical protein CHELA20_53189 [Hyphomicrobiales bacterium]|nr:hypothetical protein CHELA41_21734 [Hyphomicrobiales bacterium]CAH1683752.1 hypothetical protein CHELA20_53189 [Hyphomicrobiales bacterium]